MRGVYRRRAPAPSGRSPWRPGREGVAVAWTAGGRISVRETLARLYPRTADVERIVRDAGLDMGYIGYDPKPINQWNMVLTDAEGRNGKLDALVTVALAENPDNDVLKAAKDGAPPPALIAPDPKNWQGPTGPQLEKILGA